MSEDNDSYKKALSNAGIDSIETKNEKSLRREWKEVQLKISETGVMSITDISNTILKKDTVLEEGEEEDTRDQKVSEGTITSIAVSKTRDSLGENCIVSKSCLEAMQHDPLVIDAQVTKNSSFPDSNDASPLVTSDAKSIDENLSTNNILITQHNKKNTSRQTNEMANCAAAVAHPQQDAQKINDNNQTKDVEDELQGQKVASKVILTQFMEDNSVLGTENTAKADARGKKLSINNNISTDLTEIPKEGVKSTNEAKVGNTGSKIDALSARLQFQPKMGQVNNTYSKRTPKEKRGGGAIPQNTKKSDAKLTEGAKIIPDVKGRTNYGSTSKVSVSSSAATSAQKSVVSSTTASSQNASSVMESFGKQETPFEKDNPNVNIDVQQALNLLEQKMNVPVQVLMEPSSKTHHAGNNSAINQKSQCVQSNNIVASNVESIVSNVPTSMNSTSTLPYTVHDLMTNAAAARPTFRSGSSGCALQKLSGALSTTCSMSPMPQFSMQTPSMSIYSVPTSLKSNYVDTSQDVTTVMTTAVMTATVTSKSTSTSVPCPDAIPISLMKPSMRKQEMTAKGNNLNEICAKIGENSKEKNRAETRSKPDIPDLLKIAKKHSSSSLPDTDAVVKHIPNIPNIPVYTLSSNTTMECKTVKVTSPSIAALAVSTSSSPALSVSQHMAQKTSSSSLKRQTQPVGYKTLRDPPKSWNPTLSKNNYVAVKNQTKEMRNQTQTFAASEATNKQIPSKPAKIFKMRNMPRYLGNPASGVKPMYGVANDAKEKEQSTTSTKSTATFNMMKIDPKTLSPIVSTVNSPIVSPPPYSPNARSYQNTPFSREACRNTGSPISPRNSPVNMLSTNPFIPSPTPNTNPRIIYSHFPPSFSDASRFQNPLIRSPIGIPPPSAFHSSLPPSINKLYQRTNYIPQTTGYSPVSSQPPAVQRIPPSTHSSSPKSPKALSPSSISSASLNLGKTETQPPITSTENVVVLVPKSLSLSPSQELKVFNLSKTSGVTGITSHTSVKTSAMDASEPSAQTQSSKQNSFPMSLDAVTTSVEISNTSSSNNAERKQGKNTNAQKEQDSAQYKEESAQALKGKVAESRRSVETGDKREKGQTAGINGDVVTEHSGSKKSKEDNINEPTKVQTTERNGQVECCSSKEQSNVPKNNSQISVSDSVSTDNSKSADLDETNEQLQNKKHDMQRSKVEI